jgi:hypothetical protein
VLLDFCSGLVATRDRGRIAPWVARWLVTTRPMISSRRPATIDANQLLRHSSQLHLHLAVRKPGRHQEGERSMHTVGTWEISVASRGELARRSELSTWWASTAVVSASLGVAPATSVRCGGSVEIRWRFGADLASTTSRAPSEGTPRPARRLRASAPRSVPGRGRARPARAHTAVERTKTFHDCVQNFACMTVTLACFENLLRRTHRAERSGSAPSCGCRPSPACC